MKFIAYLLLMRVGGSVRGGGGVDWPGRHTTAPPPSHVDSSVGAVLQKGLSSGQTGCSSSRCEGPPSVNTRAVFQQPSWLFAPGVALNESRYCRLADAGSQVRFPWLFA